MREILTFHAAYHGVPHREREERADALLDELGLGERKNDRVNRYSGGMSQRLMIARALMHAPDVLFLDEPTNNLDPQSRLFLWDRIRALNAQGLTILLTTHDMNEADQLCGRIAIMDHGRILVNDTSAELKKLIPGGNAVELRVSLPAPDAGARVLEALRGLPGVSQSRRAGRRRTPPAPDDELGVVTYRLYAEAARAGRTRHAGRAAGRRPGARSAREATQPGRRFHLSDREAPALMTPARHTNRLWLAANAFGATLRRDLVVTRRELPQFLIQALIQPMFFLFIFCKILPSIGLAAGNFAALLLPGIVGLTELMAAIQGITLPLVLDLGYAREIDDRLLAPMPVWLVAAEKVLFAAIARHGRRQRDLSGRLVGPRQPLRRARRPHRRADRHDRAGGLCRIGHRPGDRHHRQAGTNQPDVLHDPDAVAVHRLHLLSMERAAATSAGSRSSRCSIR